MLTPSKRIPDPIPDAPVFPVAVLDSSPTDIPGICELCKEAAISEAVRGLLVVAVAAGAASAGAAGVGVGAGGGAGAEAPGAEGWGPENALPGALAASRAAFFCEHQPTLHTQKQISQVSAGMP